MAEPVLLVVDEDAEALAAVERELRDRYERHYRVICLSSSLEARAQLEQLAASGVDVALVVAAEQLSGLTGSDVLGGVRAHHPHARRALLVDWGDWGQPAAAQLIYNGVSRNLFDHYILRPSGSPDELFHKTISSMLLDWSEAQRAAPYTVQVVGKSWSGRAYELRELLEACAMPHKFCLADSDDGRAVVASAGGRGTLPLVVFPNGHVLEDPSNTELARGAGAPVDPEHMDYDLVIVGAGPSGLSAAVYGASEGFSVLVIDRGGIGGQATSSSLIRNYLGFPRGITGRQLAQNAYYQAWVFGAEFVFMHTAADLAPEDGRFVVQLSDGGRVLSSAILLATGATYRRLGIPSLEALNGAGVFYGGTMSEAPATAGQDVYIVGGANSAGQAALHLGRYARRVTLVVRAQSLRAGMSDYLVRQIEATPNIDVSTGTTVVGGGGEGRLQQLVVRHEASGRQTTVPADALFLMIGAKPHTDWLPSAIERDEQGFIVTGADMDEAAWSLERRPLPLETSMPGVFAAGDVRRGAVKRVASAVGEGSIAIQLLHQYFAANGLEPQGRATEPVSGR